MPTRTLPLLCPSISSLSISICPASVIYPFFLSFSCSFVLILHSFLFLFFLFIFLFFFPIIVFLLFLCVVLSLPLSLSFVFFSGVVTLLFSVVCMDAVYETSTGQSQFFYLILSKLMSSSIHRNGYGMLIICARALFPVKPLTIQDHLHAAEAAKRHQLTGVDLTSLCQLDLSDYEAKVKSSLLSLGRKQRREDLHSREPRSLLPLHLSPSPSSFSSSFLPWAVAPPRELLVKSPDKWRPEIRFLVRPQKTKEKKRKKDHHPFMISREAKEEKREKKILLRERNGAIEREMNVKISIFLCACV